MQEERRKKKSKKKNDYYSIGSKIFIICLIFLACIYASDTMLGLLGKEHIGITREVLETVKTLLFTISGYLFGKNVNHQSEEKKERQDKNVNAD